MKNTRQKNSGRAGRALRNMHKKLGPYLSMGMVAGLVLTALYLPGGWFALRDAASRGRIQGETLAPLMVAQLDSSYERNIHERMSAFMEACASKDLNCSSKKIDPESGSIWENIQQAESCLLVEALLYQGYSMWSKETDRSSPVESCTQYVLMRQSDGQILLVANDIVLEKGDGRKLELLIDGVDGTIYYMDSEEINTLPPLRSWLDIQASDWWWVLNNTYQTEVTKALERIHSEEDVASDIEIIYNESDGAYLELYDPETGKRFGSAEIWVSSVDKLDICCCLLEFGQNKSSWTMEIEQLGEMSKKRVCLYQIRLGLPAVINSIPEMAGRITLAEYESERRGGGND